MTATPSPNKEPSAPWMVGTLLLVYICALFFCGFILRFMDVQSGLIVAFIFGMYLNHVCIVINKMIKQHNAK